jgi:ElaB/YqjD/DUF883 family membrane-anchored ribosome-binding protein
MGVGKWVYDFQTLIAGILAFGLGWVALRQLHLARAQMAITTRETLINQLQETDKRARASTKEIASISVAFESVIYRDDFDAGPNISVFWAHDAEQSVSMVKRSLEMQQTRKDDTAAIDELRSEVIKAADRLEDCLRDIHQVASIDVGDPDYGFTDEQITEEKAKLRTASDAAKELLPDRLIEVRDAGRVLRDAYNAELASLRDRIRSINETIVRQGHDWAPWTLRSLLKSRLLQAIAGAAVVLLLVGAYLYYSESVPRWQTQYAELGVGMGMDEVRYIKGDAQDFLGPRDKKFGGRQLLFPRDLKAGQTDEDFDGWEYDLAGGRANLRVLFDAQKRVRTITCFSQAVQICPPLFGLSDGATEPAVIERLGPTKWSTWNRSGGWKVLSYYQLNAAFYMKKNRIYAIEVGQ